MNNGFNLDMEAAKKSGGSEWLTESGIFDFTISECRYTFGANGSQSQMMEFDLVTDDGRKCNYVSVCYQKRDGSRLNSGYNMINGLMYLCKLRNVSQVAQGDKQVAPEFAGKRVKLAVRKELKTKTDGSDTYSFGILAAFDADTGKTPNEDIEKKEASKLANFGEITDKDSRKQGAQQTSAPNDYNAYQAASDGQMPSTDGFDDDIAKW